MVLSVLRVIRRYLRKVRVQAETSYGATYSHIMVGKYLWGTLQSHRLVKEFMLTQLRQHA